MRRTALLAGFLAATLAIGACRARPDQEPATVLTEAEKAGYLPAPEIAQVVPGPAGGVIVHGAAKPGGRIRATTPSGEAYGATADRDGRFALELPAREATLLVALSVEERGRSTPAEGWLFVPTGELSRAALLRPGAAAEVLGAEPGALAAVDYDLAGGAALSGKVDANVAVRISVDGSQAGEAVSGADGRYQLRLARLSPGARRIQVAAGDDRVERDVALAAAAPAGAFGAVRESGGWRVNWNTPGGGVQSTFILAPQGGT